MGENPDPESMASWTSSRISLTDDDNNGYLQLLIGLIGCGV